MKKILCSLLALFAIGIESHAQTISVAGDVEALSSGETVTVKLHIAGVTAMTSMHFEVVLPSGFSIDNGTIGIADWAATFSNEGGIAGAISSSNNAFTGEGDIASIPIIVPNTSIGSYPVTINNVRVNGEDVATTAQFNIVVVERHTVVLDETSTVAPVAATGVNVTVLRTINADEWSTICLPFAMNATQVKAAFGNDVQLKEFVDWETTEYDTNNNPKAISVSFNEVSAIAANTPYIIKVSTAVSEFTANNVTIAPEEEPCKIVGKKNQGTLGSFTGSYIPVTIDEKYLFLNSNKFWYSTGHTQMKGYRAYFYFQDVLATYSNGSNAPIFFSFDNETTGISASLNKNEEIKNNIVYNLNGQRVVSPNKGLYIKNGKKVAVK